MKKLAPMLIATVVLVAAAVLLNRRGQSALRPSPEIGQPLLPGLAELLVGGRLQTLTLTQGDKTATLALGDQGWTVREQYGYPADFARLQRVLLDLSRVTVGQVMPGATLTEAETTDLRFLDAGGSALAHLRLGQTRQAPARDDQPWGAGPGGRFVARGGADRVFLVREALADFSADAQTWVDTQLVSVPSTDITSVAIEHPDGEKFELTQQDGGDLTLLGLGEAEEFDTSKRWGVGGALASLRFAEVVDPTLPDDVTGLATATVYRATTAKGQVYEVRIGATPEGRSERYARLSVALPPAAEETVPADEDEAAKTAREARVRERAELAQSTAALQARLAPWRFLINNFSAENMTHRRAALVRPKAAETPAAEGGEEPAPAAEPAVEPASDVPTAGAAPT